LCRRKTGPFGVRWGRSRAWTQRRQGIARSCRWSWRSWWRYRLRVRKLCLRRKHLRAGFRFRQARRRSSNRRAMCRARSMPNRRRRAVPTNPRQAPPARRCPASPRCPCPPRNSASATPPVSGRTRRGPSANHARLPLPLFKPSPQHRKTLVSSPRTVRPTFLWMRLQRCRYRLRQFPMTRNLVPCPSWIRTTPPPTDRSGGGWAQG
jgi:hypothetical protein